MKSHYNASGNQTGYTAARFWSNSAGKQHGQYNRQMHAEQIAESLSQLVLAAGVSGDEQRVAQVVEDQLSAAGYQREALMRDYLGNRWLHLGPSGEPQRLFIAHMDEIGQRITSIRADGMCTLHAIGGSDPQLWEGTPVDVHTADGTVPGCIATVSHHVTFGPGLSPKERLAQKDLLLDLGAGSATEVAALGVAVLDPVTWPKRFTALAGGCVQARSLDDRFGCCALTASAAELLTVPPSVPTVFAWSVQEEVGLRGARALAQRFASCPVVIAIDSFTTGTGPRDSKLWDNVKLGSGPVLRSLDATTIVPDHMRRELLRSAAGLGFELQFGFMAGGNDASMFESNGARVFGLSVPVQYSHTNVERIHQGDLEQLIRLIIAWNHS